MVPKGISDEEICRVANEIYQRIYQVPVRLIVKQHMERPSDLYIRCVEKSKSGDAQKEMANQGYKDGPEEMVELGLCDTEEVIFNANGNIKYVSGATQMSFFLNIDTAQLCVQIDVVNKKAQFSSRTYQGNLAYNVGDTPQSPPRSGSFLIHIPKVRLTSKIIIVSKIMHINMKCKDFVKLKDHEQIILVYFISIIILIFFLYDYRKPRDMHH